MLNEEKQVLTQLLEEAGGLLKVEAVVEHARDPSSPLHKHFEWDDGEAAEAYRQQQARALIARCKIRVIEGEPMALRLFVSLPSDRALQGGYRLMQEVLSDEAMLAQMMDEMLVNIARWETKKRLLNAASRAALGKLKASVKKQKAETRRKPRPDAGAVA